MYKTLLTDLTDNILTITINRPDKMNALNKTVIKELDEVVAEIYANKDIRSAIITGAGPRAFVAGADISEFQELSKADGEALSARGSDVFFRIASCPRPIAAAVNGFALGGGCELAMACHFRLCTPNAKFGQPEVNLGLIPGYGGTQRLTQLIGKGRALEIMLTGRMIEAAEAHTLGLVNYVVAEPNDLLTETRKILTVINEKAPLAVGRIIECVNIAAGDGFNYSGNWEPAPFGGDEPVAEPLNGFQREQQAFGECFSTSDMKEGTSAFLEKRKPVFKGK
ncbi:MAG TPA: enoyl-CoA hydratase-related protein [Puia sp.]|nr:enoyl-CoA hydratase-related protein [Puia sp.]